MGKSPHNPYYGLTNTFPDRPSVIAAPKPIPIGLGDFELKMLDLTLQPVAKVRPGQDGYLEVSQVGPYRLSGTLEYASQKRFFHMFFA